MNKPELAPELCLSTSQARHCALYSGRVYTIAFSSPRKTRVNGHNICRFFLITRSSPKSCHARFSTRKNRRITGGEENAMPVYTAEEKSDRDDEKYRSCKRGLACGLCACEGLSRQPVSQWLVSIIYVPRSVFRHFFLPTRIWSQNGKIGTNGRRPQFGYGHNQNHEYARALFAQILL